MKCILCLDEQAEFWTQDQDRDYFRCPTCDLVFVPSQFFLNPMEEKKRYDSHDNDGSDIRYQKYFEDFAQHFTSHLPTVGEGLDFGCGESAYLAEFLTRQGFKTSAFDLFYFNRPELLEKKYDWILFSEVFEHLEVPYDTVKWIQEHLNPGGIWAIRMSLRPNDPNQFKTWYYRRDLTHKHFWSDKTWTYLIEKNGFQKLIHQPPVTILKFSNGFF
jgi:hypothetical protein